VTLSTTEINREQTRSYHFKNGDETMTQGERRTTTSDNPYVISNPSLALLNLLGERGARLAEEDRSSLSDVFRNNLQIAERSLPRCNVLFIYCDIEPSGWIANLSLFFRDVVKAAGAHIAVIASELHPDLLYNPEFSKSLSAKHDWPANTVMTLNRNGPHFGTFFSQLFSLMNTGVSMPMAWVELAPQGPHQPQNIPGTICLMEAGHIAFGPSKG
jgi:hypothetical protein